MKFIGEQLAFQAREACAFAGVGYKRLDNWARTGFITPSLAAPDKGTLRFRYYSFHDVVALTVARKLRDTGFSLGALRRIKTMLAHDYQDPLWAHAWIISDGHDLFALRHHRQEILSLLKHPGQSCMPITVLDVACTAEELVTMAAQDLQKTKAEVRELIAQGVKSPAAPRKTRVDA
jgi:DNA-binding transcriptional MerR regulator